MKKKKKGWNSSPLLLFTYKILPRTVDARTYVTLGLESVRLTAGGHLSENVIVLSKYKDKAADNLPIFSMNISADTFA